MPLSRLAAVKQRGVVIASTLDTKSDEVDFLRSRLAANGVESIVIDCGVLGTPVIVPDVSSETVAAAGGHDLARLRRAGDREAAIPAMIHGLEVVLAELIRRDQVLGYAGLGGGTNAALAAASFRIMPFGLPKLLVSTNASGQTRPIVGFKDVILMNSVVDILGLNAFLKDILTRAAAIIATLVRTPSGYTREDGRLQVALTTFGCTTEGAEHAYDLMTQRGLDVLPFHARGIGGEAAEAFLRQGMADAILDLTTTEVADEIVGGIATAGPNRISAAGELGLPQVILPGAIDIVNFGPPESVPSKFAGRSLLAHTPHATLMRTSPKENIAIATFMANQLNKAMGPTAVVLPLRGFSSYDRKGARFYDPEADKAFRDVLVLRLDKRIHVETVDAHLNERRTMERATNLLLEMIGNNPERILK